MAKRKETREEIKNKNKNKNIKINSKSFLHRKNHHNLNKRT